MGNLKQRGEPHLGCIINYGTYAGNDVADRAIPHGLGVMPIIVWIYKDDFQKNGVTVKGNPDLLIGSGDAVPVTNMDSTNFHVGQAGNHADAVNAAGSNYMWYAIGPNA